MKKRNATVRAESRQNVKDNRPLVVALLLAVLVVGAFSGTLRNGLVNFDDDYYITRNLHIRAGLTAEGVAWAFASTELANWHPLTWLSHMLDCHIFGLKLWGHHLTSVLIHALNTALLFYLLFLMTGCLWRSAFVAALFALHPLRVESVAWLAERKDVLSGLFAILAMLAYVRYVRNPDRVRYALVTVTFALGLMAKPMLVTLPFVLLLLDYWPLGRYVTDRDGFRVFRGLVIEKAPMFALAGISCLVTYWAQQAGGAVESLDRLPLAPRLANAPVAYVAYVSKMVWPDRLAVLYPFPEHGIPAWQILGAVIALGLVSVLVFRARRAHPYALVGWLWYLGMLVPVIGIVKFGMQSMADRYTYLPLIGLYVIVAWAVPQLAARLGGATAVRLLFVPAGVTLLALTWGTWSQIRYWRDGVSLFRHTIAVTSDNPVAQNNLGYNLALAGRLDEAIVCYREAVRLRPDYGKVHANLGLALYQRGDRKTGLAEFEESLRLDPNRAETHTNYGAALKHLGRLAEAIQEFEEAIRLDPRLPDPHYNLAITLYFAGDYARAWEEAHQCAELGVSLPAGFFDALSQKMPDPGQ